MVHYALVSFIITCFYDFDVVLTFFKSFNSEVYWNMVEKSGFAQVDDMKTNPTIGKGNSDFLRLLIAGMKIQPCNPTFVSARDAILVANNATFGTTGGGGYRCEIWKGFAKRGLGFSNAGSGGAPYADQFDLPPGCSP